MATRRSKEAIEKEADIVRAQLKVLRAREAEFQRILDDMQRLRDSVASERQELEARQKELDSEAQPISWLPAELLIQIFLHATAADLDATDSEVYHRTPVAISHVSSKWRGIALGTSRLWSKISAQGAAWNSRPLVAFLARSKKAPLDVVFISPAALTHPDENRRAERFFIHLTPHVGRIRSIAFQSHGPEAMQRLVSLLALPISEFSSLQHLNLSISSIGPSSLPSPSLLPSKLQDSVSGSKVALTSLRLDKLPLFNIPKYFLSNLTTLELAFPPKKSSSEGPNSYMLRLSQLLRFLCCTPKLEELILSNTVPFVDVYHRGRNVVQTGASESPIIDLVHLRTFEWSYPFGTDIQYFLAFLNIPSLEKFDMSVDEFPAQRSNIVLLRGYPESGLSTGNRIISLGSIRDLSFQCLHEDTIGSVLRKFTFPVLETLELTHVPAKSDGRRERRQLPTLPRLESMFRDPRLPLLTHLTLCHFALSPELGRAEALLGYMPALETLTLDACEGVGTLLDPLQRTSGAGQPRVCPRLEAITLWRCADVDVSALVGVVIARNGNGKGGRDHGRRARGAGGSGGSGSGSSAVLLSETETAETGAGTGVTARGTGRTIRPMKKLRRQAGEAAALVQGTSEGQLLNIAAAMAVASCPATRVSYVRVEGCTLIGKEEVQVLKSLGVTDVVWREE